MKLQLLNEDLTTRIQYLLNKYYHGDTTKQELLQALTQLDPTPNYQYLEWIIKHHKSGNIRIPEDNEKIREQLQIFHTLKNKQAFKTKYPTDINKYTPSTLYNILADYEGQGQESNRQTKKKGREGQLTLPPGSELILDDGEYQIVKITGAKASETLCANTNWCTANPGPARDYLDKGPLYLIYIDGKRSYLVHYESDQFKHPDDSEVDGRTKLELIELLLPVTGKDQYSSPELAYWYVTKIDRNDKKSLEVIRKNAKKAYEYARYVLKGRWPEAEPIIIKSPEYAYRYADDILGGRWPEAEPHIIKDPKYACYYANDVIRGRWPEAEQIIIKDPKWAYYYALYVIGSGWPEAEPHIIKDPLWAYYYARDVIGNGWPEAEQIIIKDPEWAYYYALDVIRDRWPEAEPHIIKDPLWAYYYARDIIKRKWPEAEPNIMKSPEWAYYYARYVLKDRWPEAEPIIMKDPEYAHLYNRHLLTPT